MVLPCLPHGHHQGVIDPFHPERSGTLFDSSAFLAGRADTYNFNSSSAVELPLQGLQVNGRLKAGRTGRTRSRRARTPESSGRRCLLLSPSGWLPSTPLRFRRRALRKRQPQGRALISEKTTAPAWAVLRIETVASRVRRPNLTHLTEAWLVYFW